MMKLLLVNPGRWLYGYPPLSLGYLAAYLRREEPDVEIKIADENCGEVAEAVVDSFQPDIVGLTATTPQVCRAAEIARHAKRDSRRVTIIGGVHATALTEQTLKEFPEFDIACRGEGEQTLAEIVARLRPGGGGQVNPDYLNSIAGIAYREKGQIRVNQPRPPIKDLDILPSPARDLFNRSYYFNKPRQIVRGITRRATQIMSSRGCPYDCVFCSSKIMWNRKVRSFSAERVIAEIQELVGDYRIRALLFHDDLFIADRPRAKRICDFMIESGLNRKVAWAAQARANLIKPKDVDLLKLMKAAGCVQIEFGFESGNQRMLSFLKKNTVTVEQNQRALDLSHQAGLRVFGNFILGTQGETRKEMDETRRFILSNLGKMDYYQVYLACPYPGTVLWDLCRRENLINGLTWDAYGMGVLDNHVFSNTVDHDEVKKILRDLTNTAFGKIGWGDKLRWLVTRLQDDPKYVFDMVKTYVGRGD